MNVPRPLPPQTTIFLDDELVFDIVAVWSALHSDVVGL